VHADEKLSAFVELERQVLTVTFYLESIHFRFVPMTNDASEGSIRSLLLTHIAATESVSLCVPMKS